MPLSTSEVWALVHRERRQLLVDLSDLPRARWDTPSLCRGWTVHDVLAHLIDTAEVGKLAFALSMVRARGDFDRTNEDGVRRRRREDPQRTLEDFRRVLTLRRTPPAHRATRLVEAIVHGEDIRRPLGLRGTHPSEGVHDALAYQLRTSAAFGGSRERTEGCRLLDTRTGSGWGQGLEVRGDGVDLLLAATGRAIAPDLLTGPGAERLLASGDESTGTSREG